MIASLAVTASFLLLAQAWQALLWPGPGVQLTLPVIALLWILRLRDRASRWREVGTAALLTMALASSGLGVAVTAGIVVENLLARERLRQWWSVAVPSALYAAWFVAMRGSLRPPANLRAIPGANPAGDVGTLGFQGHNVRGVPANIVKAARAATGALFGIAPGRYGIVALLVLAVLVTAILARRPPLDRAASFATVGIVYWATIALTRGQLGQLESVGSSRYLYAGALVVLLLLVEVFAHPRGGRWAVAVALVLAALVLRQDAIVLHQYRRAGERAFPKVHAHQAQVERGRGTISPRTPVDNQFMPGVLAGPYLAAVHDLGSPAR
jgi:hypothetical protein